MNAACYRLFYSDTNGFTVKIQITLNEIGRKLAVESLKTVKNKAIRCMTKKKQGKWMGNHCVWGRNGASSKKKSLLDTRPISKISNITMLFVLHSAVINTSSKSSKSRLLKHTRKRSDSGSGNYGGIYSIGLYA